MLKEPEISTKRTMPFGTKMGHLRYGRDQWVWHGETGSYVRYCFNKCFNKDDAYCIGDRLIFRYTVDFSGKWAGRKLDPKFKLLLDDLDSALKWLHEADHQDWGYLFWSNL